MARNRSNTRPTAYEYPRGLLAITRGGYGFVKTAEGEFFIPFDKLNGAFDGDMVEVSPARQERSKKALARAASSTRKREARVKRVIEHAHPEIIGRYEVAEPFGVVVPEDPRIPYDIFTLRSESASVPDGAIVRVAIETYPSRKEAAAGRVVEVLGDFDDERVPVDLIVARYKLETAFSQGALEQAAEAQVDVDGALSSGYKDLRDRFVFTIDPADARDFDDAVSICSVVFTNDGTLHAADACDTPSWRSGLGSRPEGRFASSSRQSGASQAPSLSGGERPDSAGGNGEAQEPSLPGENRLGPSGNDDGTNGWRLGVHIADVSHYVPWGSSVDLDALRRATSVYLVDRVIPMLPEALSNEVCSLKPNETRRTMTVDLLLDDEGRVLDVDVYPALISSKARLTYDEAQGLIDGDSQLGDVRGDLAYKLKSCVRELSTLAKKRMALREAAGGIDFDTVEAKVKLDGEGAPVSIELRKRTDATQLIEEAMIAANESVARYLRDAGFPCIYRTHDKPSRESLAGLLPVLQEFSWFKDVDSRSFVAGNPHAIARVLEECSGRDEGALVTTLVLRSMKRALYESELGAHYALASDAYAHFTSPIRRYPDLVVHRMLRASLLGRPQKFDQEVKNLTWIAEHSSEMERIAERAASESQEVKIVELMESSVGQRFSAIITGVASFGLFVRLENTAEGVVEVADLGHEYFALDATRHTLTGADTGRQYRLGKHIAVQLVEAHRRAQRLRFRLAK
ncbi:MAG: VacB/RNase II family 3'-5' exoribonuclease [Eggerthellaceae bacterium]|nr:VacB/RNase II family 3'-5' exoribonuclease [Eggerthellaceae bacterium]